MLAAMVSRSSAGSGAGPKPPAIQAAPAVSGGTAGATGAGAAGGMGGVGVGMSPDQRQARAQQVGAPQPGALIGRHFITECL